MDTLIVGNGCAKNGATVGLLSAVSAVFPTFVQHNKGQPNLTGLPLSPVAANFLRDEGPDALGTYAPWAVDILPLPTWIQLGVALSLLFSGMAFGHRFNLWRIDAQRVRIEREIPALFHPGVTLGEIAEMRPDRRPQAAETRAAARRPAVAPGCAGRALPPQVAVDPGADGRGDVLPLPGDADRRTAVRAAPVPRPAAARYMSRCSPALSPPRIT